MVLLVAGAAAILDLLLAGDALPDNSTVGRLDPTPGASGHWLPGGAALTIALAARQQGCAVALWHPLPDTGAGEVRSRLRRAGVDLSRAPRHQDDMARCVMVQAGERRIAWSGVANGTSMAALDTVLQGVSHVAIAPRWGEWTDALLRAAAERDIPVSLIGEPAPNLAAHRWHCVVLDHRQIAQIGNFEASILVATFGEAGAVIRTNGREISVPAVPVRAVDTTGAGDVFGATFLACQLNGQSLEEAGRAAAALAARTCEGWGAWAALDSAPAAHDGLTNDARARGALAGMACGDAFGMPNSFLQEPVWLTRMMPGPSNSPYHAGYQAGRITDDTEQALALTLALEDGLTAGSAARRLHEWFIAVGGETSLAVGPSTRRAMMAFQEGAALAEIGRTGVTNGAAMRIAPIGVHAGLLGLELEATIDLVETACQPTHATGPAIAGASAIAVAIATCLAGKPWEAVMEQAICGARAGARRGQWTYAADVAERALWARKLAQSAGSPAELARMMSEIIGAGEPTTESVPAALAIADYSAGDPALAIEIAGNLRGDTDTVAAMAGAICGAYSGMSALPAEWVALVSEVNRLDFAKWSQRLSRTAGISSAG